MWKKFLKSEQGPFLVPPRFKSIKVKSSSEQVFNVRLNRALRNWGWVTSDGDPIRPAQYYEIAEELERYPSVLCAYINQSSGRWIVATRVGPLILRLTPRWHTDRGI